MPGIVTERDYTVHYYEIDSKQNATIATIVNYLNDIAILQTEEAGVGIEHLKTNNIAWVLFKWDIKINKFPKLYENVKVRTWSYCIKKFYAYRQFDIIDSNGETIITANSLWFMINTETRKPMRVPEYMYDAYKTPRDEDFSIEIEKLSMPENIQHEKSFHVRYSDIDTNNHVNNANYIDWAIETVPLEILAEKKLKNIIVIYEKETCSGETITSVSEKFDNGSEIVFSHAILNANKEKVTLIKTVWVS
jgi:medium-chain acyl-[acyl-carrier-protein] hydrolase